jgi:hypothetical protein
MNRIINELRTRLIGNNVTIASVSDALQLHEKLIELRVELIINHRIEIMPHYRGEKEFGWNIVPGIFRVMKDIDGAKGKKLEEQVIQSFEKQITETYGTQILRTFFNTENYGHEWDLLFQAQHAGIKTTLTDWTAEILIALYFAVEKSIEQLNEDKDGQVWCLLMPTQNLLTQDRESDPRSLFKINPFEIKNRFLVNPTIYLDKINKRIFENRMLNQGGRFLVSPSNTCHIPINKFEEIKDFLVQVKIPSQFKLDIRDQLANIGITRTRMYIDENQERQSLISKINQEVFGIS